jgi:hypothetical protein
VRSAALDRGLIFLRAWARLFARGLPGTDFPGIDRRRRENTTEELMDEQSTRDAVKGVADSARSRAGDQARRLADQARERASGEFEHRKTRAAGQLDEVAEAVRAGGARLRESQHDGVARQIEKTADHVHRLSEQLREMHAEEMLGYVRDLARQHPALFVGSAALAGAIGARFLRSSGAGVAPSLHVVGGSAASEDWQESADDWMEPGGVLSFVRRNPLLVGAGMLALGAALGAAVPPTASERRWMGPARDQVLERARTAARRALDEARVAGGKMAADAVNRAVSGKTS